jgi:hypothetical protein
MVNIITAPMIWFCFFPILFMDVVAEAYQFIVLPENWTGGFVLVQREMDFSSSRLSI